LDEKDPQLAELELRDLGPEDSDISMLSAEQKMNRATLNLHAAGAFEDQEGFVEDHFYTPHVTRKLLRNTVSLLQMSARTHESETAHAAAQFAGFFKLPNRCIGNDKIGKTITLAVNYENPNLVACLIAIPFSLGKCMPELLIAITPISIESNKISPECLMGNVMKENNAGKDNLTPQQINSEQTRQYENSLTGQESDIEKSMRADDDDGPHIVP